MRSNNRIINVLMPWSSNIEFTVNDIVFNVTNELTGNNPNVLLICTQDALGLDNLDSDHFKSFHTSEYENRAKTSEEAVGPNKLVAASAVKDILSKIGGQGYNGSGVTEILPDNTDLNSVTIQSKFRLLASFTYTNIPVDITNSIFAYLETNKITGATSDTFYYVQFFVNVTSDLENGDPIPIIFYRVYTTSWSNWRTSSQSDAARIFDQCYTNRAAVYQGSINYLNKILTNIGSNVVKLVAQFSFDDSPHDFDVSGFSQGYYKILINNLDEDKQYSLDFSYEDILYVVNSTGEIILAGSDDGVEVTLRLVNSTPVIRTTCSLSNYRLIFKIYRLPLTYLSYV